jgi:hypothetical protein
VSHCPLHEVSKLAGERSMRVHQTEGPKVRVVGEGTLNHLYPELEVSDPLELLERSEFRKCSRNIADLCFNMTSRAATLAAYES